MKKLKPILTILLLISHIAHANVARSPDIQQAVESLGSYATWSRMDFVRKFFGISELSEATLSELLGDRAWVAKHRADQDFAEKMKENLYLRMTSGETDIAEALIDKGVKLDNTDLSALLFDALQPQISPKRHSSKWREWLLAHGADINEPQLNALLYDQAALLDDTELLGLLITHDKGSGSKNPETVESFIAKGYVFPPEYLVKQLTKSLRLAVQYDSVQATNWLLRHGADATVLEEPDALLEAAMLDDLRTKQRVNRALAHLTRNINPDIINKVLWMTITLESSADLRSEGKHLKHQDARDDLIAHGASVDDRVLRDYLYDTMGKGVTASALRLAIKHGGDISAEDLNVLVSKHFRRQITSGGRRGSDMNSFFHNLKNSGLDLSKLNIPQLLQELDNIAVDEEATNQLVVKKVILNELNKIAAGKS